VDYKIKFEYKGMGKQAAGIRQRAIKSQQGAGKAASGTGKARDSARSIKTLNSTIQKLIASNKSLENAFKRGSGGGGGGRGSGGGGGGRGSGSSGFGRIGASIPIVGAAIAALGFAISKINQIGNAYIGLAGQQLGDVGTSGGGRSGFGLRGGSGVYKSAEMSAGMKAYAQSTGRFERGAANRDAMNVGAIYGLSSTQVMGQAGTMTRAGLDYGRVAAQGAGVQVGGRSVQSELPALLSGVAGLMEESIRAGINTSNMSQDIGEEIAVMAMMTPGQSVEAAMGSIRNFQGTQSSVARGQMGTMDSMYTAQATRDILMENLADPEYVARLQKNRVISERQATAIGRSGHYQGSYQDLQRTIGDAGAYELLRMTAAETSTPELQNRMVQGLQATYGTSDESRQRVSAIMAGQGSSITAEQLRPAWRIARGDVVSQEGAEARGRSANASRARGVTGSSAGSSRTREIGRENLVFQYGASFAKVSLQMEEAMLTIAHTAAPVAIAGINAVGTATTALSSCLTGLAAKISAATDSSGSFSIWKFMTGE